MRTTTGRLVTGLAIAGATMVAATVVGKAMRDVWHVGRPYWLLRPFDVNGEGNVWTWFSSSAHLLLASASAYLAVRSRAARDGQWLHWAGLAAAFLVLSVDETAALHEESIEPLRRLFDAGGLLYNAWVIPAFVLLAVMAIVYIPFVARQPRSLRWMLVVGGGLFVLGGAGVELLTGAYKEDHGTIGFTFGVLTALEESLEIAGLLVLVAGVCGQAERALRRDAS